MERWCDLLLDGVVALLATWTVAYHVCLVLGLPVQAALAGTCVLLAATVGLWRSRLLDTRRPGGGADRWVIDPLPPRTATPLVLVTGGLTVIAALAEVFPDDPPRFLARTPHGYADRTVIERDVRDAGYTTVPRIDVVAARSRADSARVAAVALCEGTPLLSEIEARDASRL